MSPHAPLIAAHSSLEAAELRRGRRGTVLVEVREGVFVDAREVIGIFDPQTARLYVPDAVVEGDGTGGIAALVLTDRGVVASALAAQRLAQQLRGPVWGQVPPAPEL